MALKHNLMCHNIAPSDDYSEDYPSKTNYAGVYTSVETIKDWIMVNIKHACIINLLSKSLQTIKENAPGNALSDCIPCDK